MTQAVGSRSQIIFTPEAIWGTTPGSPSCKGIPFTSETFGLSIGSIESAEIDSSRMLKWRERGNYDPRGDISVELAPEGFGTLLKHALGNAVTVGSASPFTHTIKGYTSLPEGLTIEIGHPDVSQYFVYKGCKVSDLVIDGAQADYLKATFTFLGKTPTAPAAVSIDASPAYPTLEPFVCYQAVFEEAGVTVATVLNFNISLTNGLQEDGYIYNDRERASMVAGLRRITGSFEAFFENEILFNKFRDGTPSSFKALFTSGAYSMEIYIPNIEYTGSTPTTGGPDPIKIPMNWQALKDDTEDTDIKITLINSVPTI
jgi:hypothetical protein